MSGGTIRTERLLLRLAGAEDVDALARAAQVAQCLEPASRHRGYATEAARAVIAFALAVPGVSSVWGATAITNLASAAVMRRAGMRFEQEGPLDGVPSFIFRIRKVAAA